MVVADKSFHHRNARYDSTHNTRKKQYGNNKKDSDQGN